METTKPDQFLFRYSQTDTKYRISRATTVRLAEALGLSGETQLIHYALRKLAYEILPGYEADDGDLTSIQMQAIREAVQKDKPGSVKSSLFDRNQAFF
ncbi:hypothetical protein ACO0K9_19125 [Undibacterium sp. Ji50W]|uniref:hypothetical protein n=1 Tax=Undibacterium sp. Ji50W TaxID=3413041 RepID=UPI003BEFACAA